MMAEKKGFCNLGFAKIDTDRKRRRGFSEAIFCPGKSLTHLKEIIRTFIRNKQDVLLTKLEHDTWCSLKKSFPRLQYNRLAKLGYIRFSGGERHGNEIVVISAGTADIPIAEEAAVTLELMGNKVVRLYDVGVAGVHRLMSNIALLRKAG